MVKVEYKTVTGSNGAVSVNIGISRDQILKVSRQGIQKDYNSFLALADFTGNEYAFIPRRKAITFGTYYPFVGDEVIHIIYKVSV